MDPLVAHCTELLAPLGRVRVKRMFGGHGLYVDEVFVAIIAFDRLYLKTDEATRPQFLAAGCEPFEYEAKGRRVSVGYFTAPADAMESPALMLPWARLALQAALAARSTVKPRAAQPARTGAAAKKKPR